MLPLLPSQMLLESRCNCKAYGYIDILGKQKETTRTGFACLPSSQSDQHTGVMPPSIIMSLPLNCIEEAFQSMLYGQHN